MRTLEDRIAEKNQELNGFSAQLRELQGLLHANLEKQSQSGTDDAALSVGSVLPMRLVQRSKRRRSGG